MLAPGTAIGRYVVRRRLAEGGMAEVYLAQATGPEGFSKDVVIKVVRSFLASDQQFVDMFINEARLSSRLNHANVVQIFDFGKHEQSYFIAMEYVRGTSLFDLRKRCRDRGIPFPPTLVAEIGAQVARGLQYAHSLSDKGKLLGIVHRDVTPHNVLLSFDGAVKLTDFGIAKASTTHTAPGVLKGKFAYMAPEQARGEMVDSRTDIFALAVVLWEMLTGGRLFDGDSEMAVLRAVQESLIAPPSRLNPDVPSELSDIILKALSRPPHERHATAFEFEKALATFVLRAAKSVEDTSVSLFLQQVYRDELDAEERPMTPIATPAVQRGVVPQASSFGTGDTHAVDRSAELARGRAAAEAEPSTDEHGLVTSRSPVRTEQMKAARIEPAGPVARTDQMPALQPGSRTDQMPAYRPSQPLPSQEGTDVGPPRVVEQRRTDPERKPLGAEPLNLENSAVRLSDSVKLDVEKRIAEHAASKAEAGAREPTVLKPRAIALDLGEPSFSGPTLAADPPKPPRSPLLLVASVVTGLVVIVGTGFAVSGGKDEALPPVTVPVTAIAVPVDPAPPALVPLEPVAVKAVEGAVDAGVAVAEVTKPTVSPPVDVPTTVPPPVETKPVAPTARYGSISVKAVPYAEVSIDNRRAGEVTGTSKVKVPYGKHRVTLVHPRRTETFDVVIDGKSVPELSFNANK
ncbi:MAG: protein kinase [Myxococcales bacterium]|nr:protein kinase [Myxococcales bacterium]